MALRQLHVHITLGQNNYIKHPDKNDNVFTDKSSSVNQSNIVRCVIILGECVFERLYFAEH
jgi:hypothetical protein